MHASARADAFQIRRDDLSGPAARELVALHIAGMQASSPSDGVFALGLSALQKPDIAVWTVWRDARIAGIGALRDFGDRTAEVKSMRTHPDFLRRGVATLLLDHLIAHANARRIARLSLETGSGPQFEAAWSFYTRRGFVPGPAFAAYPATEFNRFLHLAL